PLDWHALLAKPAADAADQRRERRPLTPEPALDARAQCGGEERTLARGRDGDEQRVAAHDGGRDEAALLGPVDDVDEDAGRLGLRPALPVDAFVVAAGVYHQARAGEVTRRIVAGGEL